MLERGVKEHAEVWRSARDADWRGHAEHDLRAAAEVAPQDPRVHYSLGRLSVQLGADYQAWSHFSTALAVESPAGVKVEPLKRPLQPALYTEGDLHVRQFTDATARRVARAPYALQQSA